ncbi:MAG: ATP-binding cassette domain-containing protein, partial [Bifidobacteriaceae bacterium]|nr:ATP-binding cassette domain-containing protein [Bifidobacteriaceae bacterium]
MTATVPPTQSDQPTTGPLTELIDATVGAPALASGIPAESGNLAIRDVDCFYGSHLAVAGVSLEVPGRSVTAFIGPSGCGKSTLLRAINRMHEVIPGARTQGNITLDGQDLYARGVDPVAVRSKVGMVFQK